MRHLKGEPIGIIANSRPPGILVAAVRSDAGRTGASGRKPNWSVERALVAPGEKGQKRDRFIFCLQKINLSLFCPFSPAVVDLGTGSGPPLRWRVASELTTARIIATDASKEALAVAARNAQRLQLTNVTFVPGNWFAALPRSDSTSSSRSALHRQRRSRPRLRRAPQRALARR